MKAIHLCLITHLLISGMAFAQQPVQPVLGKRSVTLLREQSLTFKDLNKNNRLDPYEDWRLPIKTRVNDLLGQMTLAEKIGFILISTTRMGGDNTARPDALKARLAKMPTWHRA